MIGIVKVALNRPLTFIVMAILIAIVGSLAALRTPVDIFPNIRIPVIAAAWKYSGLPPEDMAGRIISPYERVLTTTVNDIDHIESQSLPGHRHRQDLFPARCRHPHRHRAGHLGLADRAQPDAAGHDPAADPELQRVDRADPAARPVGQGPVRTAVVRPRPESDPPGAGHRSGRSPCPIRRAAGRGRSRSTSIRCAAVQGTVGAGRRRRDRRAEPDQPGRLRQDRLDSSTACASTTRRARSRS